MYCQGLGLHIIDRFDNHQGFDGVMLGMEDADYHFEFTYCRSHPVVPTPTHEDLAVFYLPILSVWQSACANLKTAGFKRTDAFNPYWDIRGHTYIDHDDYRIVLQHDGWRSVASP